ncbi:hypothetical protein SAMN05444360_10315 [Chryseobacterium carnipullorum]|uniref:hypothetical protein n=1 Tax=Chryseobacterium carnipullorum TaxID=1124835 RepID=UPI00092447EB|nr:hypothetical protein [Chryseobacterium carnipullorum]SHL59823.1 hypothetical protein SAMN05444360_10315 [Chryseobacterium carnipullorum]
MRTIKFLRIIYLITLMLFFVGCKKDRNREYKNESSEQQQTNIAPIDSNGDSIYIKKYDYLSFHSILTTIPDTDADKYYEKYSDNYKPHLELGKKYPFSINISRSVGEEMKKMIKKNDSVRLILTTRDNHLDVLFADSANNKYIITDSAIKQINDKDFKKMDSTFKVGIYNEMTDTKIKLVDSEHSGDKTYGNTTEILIPYAEFDKYDPAKHTLAFLPGVVTNNTFNSKKKSKMHHLTLIMCLMDLSRTKALRTLPTVFSDDFCLKPPGC